MSTIAGLHKYFRQGVFQDYYQTTLLSHSSSSTIALVGAIQLFFLYGGGPIIGRIYDAYGTSVSSVRRIAAFDHCYTLIAVGPDPTRFIPSCVLHDDALAGATRQAIPNILVARHRIRVRVSMHVSLAP